MNWQTDTTPTIYYHDTFNKIAIRNARTNGLLLYALCVCWKFNEIDVSIERELSKVKKTEEENSLYGVHIMSIESKLKMT